MGKTKKINVRDGIFSWRINGSSIGESDLASKALTLIVDVSTLCIGGSTNMHQSWRSPIPMSYPVPGISTVPGVTMITRLNSAYPHSNE